MNTETCRFRFKGSYFCYALTYFCYFLMMALFGSVLSVYLTGIGKSASEMSFIISSAGLFSFVMVPVAGYLNDLTGNPRLISSVLLGAAGAAGLVFSASRSVWALFLLNGLIQSSVNCVMPICERMAGSSRYRYGSIRVWGTLGYAAGAQCAGICIEHLPPQALFFFVAGAALLTILGFSGTDRLARREASAGEEPARKKPKLSSLARSRQFLLFLLVAFLFSGCSGVNMSYSPVLLTSLNVSTGAVGTVLFFSTLVEIPLIVYSNKFMDLLSGKALMSLGFAIILVQFLCYGFSSSPAFVIAVMVALKAVASTLFVMVSLKIVRNVLDPSLTTTGLSVVNSMNNLAGILMQNVGGAIVDRSSVQTLYLCLTALAALGLLCTLFLKVPNREKVFG